MSSSVQDKNPWLNRGRVCELVLGWLKTKSKRYLLGFIRRIVWVDVLVITEHDLTQRRDRKPPSITVEFRVGTFEDLDSLTPELGYSDKVKAQAKEDMEAGDIMSVGIHEGEIVHVGCPSRVV